MFEEYHRRVLIRRVNYPDGKPEYRVTYYTRLFSNKKESYNFDSKYEVLKHLIHLPHKDRVYYGFEESECGELEHTINGTIERRRLIGLGWHKKK